MCGIAGIISADQSNHQLIETMTDAMSSRGPDGRGFYRDRTVSLGHRRLAIIDLSSDGAQPMQNEDGTVRLVCNGEIYNYVDKTVEMKARGHAFRSKCDCETLIHLYEEYDCNMLTGVNGMYAFALWDKRRNRMVLAVDRFGKKPLYYAVSGDSLVFASEMKSLLVFDWIRREMDLRAIDRYLSLRYIPAPMTILKSVRKLEAASMMVWENGKFSIKRYWDMERSTVTGGEMERFGETFTDAVRLRLQSDVPVGIYLSGGVDSSAVARIMADLTEKNTTAFTACFDYAHNEHPRAERLAGHLGFDYDAVSVAPDDFRLMPDMVYHLDEPFADLLCIPAFLLARKAKEKVSVVLTGDGADEILSGYFHQRVMVLYEKFGAFLRAPGVGRALSGIVDLAPAALLNLFFDYPDRLGSREKLKLSQAVSRCGRFGDFYEGITCCFTRQDKEAAYTGNFLSEAYHESLAGEFQEVIGQHADFSFLSRLSMLDLKYWIPFSVIFRLDKMNMAHAVEARSPFLDYRLVEMALNLPDYWKMSGGRGKVILRRLIERMYPPDLREKGKQAFYMPLTSAYRDGYMRWVEGLLDRKTVESQDLFRWEYVDALLRMSRRGSMLASRQLTALAMLQQWVEVFINAPRIGGALG